MLFECWQSEIKTLGLHPGQSSMDITLKTPQLYIINIYYYVCIIISFLVLLSPA